MPIYKKYHSDAATEGRKSDFTLYSQIAEKSTDSQQVPRFYPDEWLIVNVLQKYAKLRLTESGKTVHVLAERWAGNGVAERGNTLKKRVGGEDEVKDEGYSNTPGFNKTILNAVENCHVDTLLLVPYLYIYHHPGMAIHINKSKNLGNAIYIDPFGVPPKKPEVFALQDQLAIKHQCQIQQVETQQQHGGSICGFVLAASMMKFIEEFITRGKITTEGFLSPKPNMDTAYLFEMYVNNWQFAKYEPLVDEVMLAEQDLWNGLIDEQKIPNAEEVKTMLAKAVVAQDAFLTKVIPSQMDTLSLNKRKLDFIRDFQSKMIEHFFIRPAQLDEKIEKLVSLNAQLLATNSVEEFDTTWAQINNELHLDNLLSDKWVERTKIILKISPDPMEYKHAKSKSGLFAQVVPVAATTSGEKSLAGAFEIVDDKKQHSRVKKCCVLM